MRATDIDTAREINDDFHINVLIYPPAFPESFERHDDELVAERLCDAETLQRALSANNLSMDTAGDWDYFLTEAGEMFSDARFMLPSTEESHFAEIGRKFYDLVMAHVNKSLDEE